MQYINRLLIAHAFYTSTSSAYAAYAVENSEIVKVQSDIYQR